MEALIKMFTFCFVVLILICPFACSFGLEPHEEEEDNDMSQDELVKCFFDVSCYLGEEAYQKIWDCVNILPPEEMKMAFDWFLEYPIEFESEASEERLGQMCKDDEETHNDYFEFFADRLTKIMLDYCKNPMDNEQCNTWEDAHDCTIKVLKEYHDREEC
ncbi:uncharacterized protein LOC118183132 [Stegodyphus dumicola]|uniref:uncharacterized protein LOC118183132 n=1 Tax=Stegodyphus dumicola TaxID=202533 RepID=UPI0015B2415A|nr:uncharacterized protein LOC118183132 [Stegodyphus dumicola]